MRDIEGVNPAFGGRQLDVVNAFKMRDIKGVKTKTCK
jgi:hypothetical protein